MGGGIGGLSAALSLLRAGFDVQVYERARELGEVGAGIQISPNASRVLHGLGLADELAEMGVRPLAWHQRRWDDGSTLLRTPLAGAIESAFGYPHYQMHRADLLAALARALPAERVHLQHRLTGLVDHGDRVEAEFAGGERAELDLLVGADGIHSVVRGLLFGPEDPNFTGCAAYRGLVPADRLSALGLEVTAQVWLGAGRHFVHYFVQRERLVNFVAIVDQDSWTRESWTDRGNVDEALAAYEGYYGGRTETMLRRTPVPGVYLDFRSQYPTAFVLQRLWRYLICEAVDFTEVDPGAVREQLEAVDIEAVLDPSLWPALDMIVLVDPDGDRLPTRARFPRSPTRRGILEPPRTFNVAVPYRSGGDPQWWTLADCLASMLHTGKVPKIVRAIRFQALGVQEGLQPIDVAGNPSYRIDPYTDDFIKRLVEMRAEVKAEMKAAKRAGDLDRARQLDAIQLGMKITANSIAYGVGIEMNVIEHRKRVDATVYLPDGDSYRTKLERSEQPGKWFHPLVATLVTGGGRLLLAAAMNQIEQAGGVYATCDTDAVFPVATKDGGLISCPGGTHRTAKGDEAVKALSWAEVDDITSRFEPLNLFDQKLVPGSILELEDENLDPDSGEQRQIECFAIASKRYTLFVRDENYRPQIIGGSDKRKRSEHGLGHLLPPNALGPEIDDSAWKDRWWEHLLCLELGVPDPEPAFFSLEAVGRLTVTSPREEKTFRTHNDGLPYAERVRPWNFLCMAHPTQTERARKNGPQCLVAPFERDPVKRRTMDWIDRNAPERGTTRIRTDPLRRIEKGSTAVLSYGDYFDEYRLHPEAKTLAPDGQPCQPWTRGLLQPRHVTPSKIIRIGKESNRLSETAMPLELDEEAVVEYPAPRVCPGCRTTVEGRRKWCSEACRKRTERRRDGSDVDSREQRAPLDPEQIGDTAGRSSTASAGCR